MPTTLPRLAELGYGLHIVFSNAFSIEKGHTCLRSGAVVEEVPSIGGQIDEALIKSMIAQAGEVAVRLGASLPVDRPVQLERRVMRWYQAVRG